MYLKDGNTFIDHTDIVCIYHYGCIDGVLSAALVSSVFKDVNFIKGFHNQNIEYYQSYIDSCYDKNVYIVDYVPPRSVLEEIAKVCKKMVILDHHADKKYAKDVEKKYSNKVYLKLDMGRSGVGLTWDFINEFDLNNFENKKQINKIVNDMSDYDLWKHEGRCNVENIAFFLKIYREKSPQYVKEIIFDKCNIDVFYSTGKVISDLYFDKIKRYKYDFNISDAVYRNSDYMARGLVIHDYDSFYFNELSRYLLKKPAFSFVVGTKEVGDNVGLDIRSKDNKTAFNIASFYGENGGGHKNSAGTVMDRDDFYLLSDRCVYNF